MANKKYLDEVGVAYLINLLNDYPDNEILATLIDAIQDGLDEKVNIATSTSEIPLVTQSTPGLMSSMDKTILDGFNPNVSTTISNIAVDQFEIINAKQENALSIENTIEPQIGAQIRTSNLLDVDTFTPGFYIGANGSLSNNANDHVGDFIPVTPGDTIYYTGTIGPTNSSSINRRLHVYNANKTWIKQLNFAGSLKVGDNWSTSGVVPSNGAYVRVSWGVGDTNVMISVGAPAKYEPYYIKPFAILTDTTVNISSDNTVENTNSYQIDFPVAAGNVYSAIVYPIEGKLYVTSGHISSYNGETLTTQWWSDRDNYVEGNSPTTGAEVVYALDEEDWIEYDITPTTIPLFYHQNYISVDLGVITSFTYYAETFGVTHLTTSDGITMGQTNIVEQDVQNWNNTVALINTKADLESPMFTGAPTIDRAPGRSDSSLRIATAGFVQNLGNNITKVETTVKATQNYDVGDYVIVQGVLYKVTTPIASGTTISSGTNVTPTTVMDEIKALISAINS